LEVPGRADAVVHGGGVAVGAVQIVGPIVDIVRPWLDVAGPRFALADHRHASGGEDAEHLIHRHAAQVLGHDEVRQVRRVRQAVARPSADRDGAVEAFGADAGANLLDGRRVGVQGLDDVGVARAEGGGQVGVGPAAEMDDEAAADAGGVEQSGGPGLGRGLGRGGGPGGQQRAGPQAHKGQVRPAPSAPGSRVRMRHDGSFRLA